MVRKEFMYYGKSLDELKEMSLKEFIRLLPARKKRSLSRGFTEMQKRFLKKVRKVRESNEKKPVKTHCRDMIVVPEMLGLLILVHNGKGFTAVNTMPEMLGHYLGEFTVTRKKVEHSAPGIGATRSSAALSVK